MYKLLTIIIPVFNEEKYILSTIKKALQAQTNGLNKEIIIVDDGSTDSTQKIIKDFLKRPQSKKIDIQYIRKKNGGKGTAVKLGFKASRGDIVLIQDADLEYDPNDYACLIDPFLRYQADVVYGSRFVTDHPRRVLNFWHYCGNIFITTLSNILTNLNLTDIETGYKAFRGDLIRSLAPKIKSRGFDLEPEITALAAHVKDIKFFEVGISYSGRTYTEGKKLTWIDGIRAVVRIFDCFFFR